MKADFGVASRKRPVNLTLSDSLVRQVKSMTDNLSGVVESLLSDFVSRERRAQLQKSRTVEETVVLWNKFNSESGSIADEYSSL